MTLTKTNPPMPYNPIHPQPSRTRNRHPARNTRLRKMPAVHDFPPAPPETLNPVW